MLDKCKTFLSHCSYIRCPTFLSHITSLYNAGGVWVNWFIVCGFHICQVWEKPDFMKQLSSHKPGQRRCFARRGGSQTKLALCKLYMYLLQRLYHHSLSALLVPKPEDSIQPWANSPHLYIPQFWPIWQFLLPVKESGQLDPGQAIYWILFKGRSFVFLNMQV